jgi:hypothetical protein
MRDKDTEPLRCATAISTGRNRSAKLHGTCSSSQELSKAPWGRVWRSICKVTDLQFQHDDDRELEARAGHRPAPRRERVRLPGAELAQFRHDVGIGQERHVRPAGRTSSRERETSPPHLLTAAPAYSMPSFLMR